MAERPAISLAKQWYQQRVGSNPGSNPKGSSDRTPRGAHSLMQRLRTIGDGGGRLWGVVRRQIEHFVQSRALAQSGGGHNRAR
jgi:hypothetical protein